MKISRKVKENKAYKKMTKGILVEVELIVLLWGCDTKSLYHGEMED